ncbi:hypothetical protein RHO12_03570 [Orbus sturtevantii]|uniref:hypothetical protein n=1 Tax=Orbus sturtevantii TaxID=3074109 RepID=UPI00370D3BB5
MAKPIKSIKCFNCGSIAEIKLANNRYYCKSCSANCLLADDSKNTKIKQPQQALEALNISKNKTSVVIISCIIGLLFLVMVINYLINQTAPQKYTTNTDDSSNSSLAQPTIISPTTSQNSTISNQAQDTFGENSE